MKKNKIAIGLGLLLSLTVEASLANTLGGSNAEITNHHPFVLSLENKLDMSADKYYTITCQLNNTHNAFDLGGVSLANGLVSDASINGQPAKQIGQTEFTFGLVSGNNTLVLNHVHPGKAVESEVLNTPAVYEEKEVATQQSSGWFTKNSYMHIFPREYTVVTKQKVLVQPATYKKVSSNTSDELHFYTEAEHKSKNGYIVDTCEAAEETSSVSTPVSAPLPAIDPTPTVDATPAPEATSEDAAIAQPVIDTSAQ